MSVIDIAKSHFESLGVQSIEIPEWKDADGKSNYCLLESNNTCLKRTSYLENSRQFI
jgi:hypothetical protein